LSYYIKITVYQNLKKGKIAMKDQILSRPPLSSDQMRAIENRLYPENEVEPGVWRKSRKYERDASIQQANRNCQQALRLKTIDY